jgi:hypothetical protein
MPVRALFTEHRRCVELQESVALQMGGGAAPIAGGPRGAPKQALGADLLATLVERRLNWLPAVRAALARDARCLPRPGLPCRHERDAAGRNWDLRGFDCGPIDETACPEVFRTVVDRLRDEFDIA